MTRVPAYRLERGDRIRFTVTDDTGTRHTFDGVVDAVADLPHGPHVRLTDGRHVDFRHNEKVEVL